MKKLCKCFDFENIQGWGVTSINVSYTKKGGWDIDFVGETSIDFDAGFECVECGELWQREDIENLKK